MNCKRIWLHIIFFCPKFLIITKLFVLLRSDFDTCGNILSTYLNLRPPMVSFQPRCVGLSRLYVKCPPR